MEGEGNTRIAAESLAPRTDAIIRLRGVRKSFGSHVVLDGIDLDIPRGRTTVVLGPSGCGKSVTLKHIVGLLRPDAGEVYFEDLRVDTLSEAKLREIRLQVGFLFQMGALFDSMTVKENLLFPLQEHSRLHSKERTQRIAEALDRVDLHGVSNLLPSQLSGGQRKRVALARAIVLEPRVVLYDEPTTGLDPIRSDGIDQLVLKLERELGVTSVVVTHDLVSARKIAAKVVMLLDGKIAAEGTYDEVAAWNDPRVQQFMQGRYMRDDDVAPAPAAVIPSISKLLQPKTWRGPSEKGSKISAPEGHADNAEVPQAAPSPTDQPGTPIPHDEKHP